MKHTKLVIAKTALMKRLSATLTFGPYLKYKTKYEKSLSRVFCKQGTVTIKDLQARKMRYEHPIESLCKCSTKYILFIARISLITRISTSRYECTL